MKRIITLILVFTLMILKTTCAYYMEPIYPYNNKEKVTIVSKDVNGKKYRVPYFIVGLKSCRIYSIDNIEELIGKAYIRYNNGRYYAIYKTGSKKKGYHYLIVTFNQEHEDFWYVTKIPSKKKFKKKVKKGTHLKTVKKIDRDTYNTAFYNEYTPQYESFHRFKDGTVAFVTYKKNKKHKWVVKQVRYERDKMNVVKNLLKKDYRLIK